MEIKTLTIEFLRAGPRHNQLLSPITPYLGVCGNSPASRVTLPFEHGEIEQRLQDLRYRDSSPVERARAGQVLDKTGHEIAQLLSEIEGVPGMLNPAQDRRQTLTHLRIVFSASELAMLPFEASKVPSGKASGGGNAWLALQTRAPVCITRHIRSVATEEVPWPTSPRVLFIAGPDTPVVEHRQALETALRPWRDDTDRVGHLLTVLEQPTVATIGQEFRAATLKGAPYTHVHVLAHGGQVDSRDRYSPVALYLKDGEEAVRGEYLASALTAVGQAGTVRPAVVTLASCDSGQQVDVRTTDAALAHDLHDQGIPLVVASQFPLTVQGSVPFVARFYEGQLRGEHPLESLYAVRLDLHGQMGAVTHDWASLAVYEALPANLAQQLEGLRYWQARRAHDCALKRLEALARQDRPATGPDFSWRDRLVAVDACVADLPTSGPYSLECAGLRASAHKRVAFAALEQAALTDEAGTGDEFMKVCRQRLDDARIEYWRASKAFLAPSTEPMRRKANLHWLLGQVISLDVALGKPLDEAMLTTACLAADIDLHDCNEVERAWAHVSLSEFNLLRLSAVELSPQQREVIASKAIENTQAFIRLMGHGSEHVFTTGRQFGRYVSWWGNPRQQAQLSKLGVRERPHWHVEHGLVPTATRLVELLQRRV